MHTNRSILGLALAFGVLLQPSSARTQEVPVIEPRYTRVFGSDTLNIWFPEISPDGRWIAFSDWKGTNPESVNLWLVPANGGEPVRLTEGPYWDDSPMWFPGSDRIAFRSDRPSRPGQSSPQIMTLGIDPVSGQPVGPPRQVTLKGAHAYHDVSPDGKWIAYTPPGDAGRVLDVIPAEGGVSRTLSQGEDIAHPVWSTDGQSIYWQGDPDPDSWIAPLMRISVDGGDPDTVLTWFSANTVFAESGTEFIVRGTQPGPGHSRKGLVEIADMKGNPLARFEVPEQMTLTPSNFGHQVLAVVTREATSVHVMPVGGGATRAVTEGIGEDEVFGWSDDGRRLLIRSVLANEPVLFLARPSGGPMQQIRLPDTPLGRPFRPVLSGDGRYVLYAARDEANGTEMLKVFDMNDGQARVLSTKLAPFSWATGAGGQILRDGHRFLFTEKVDGACALRGSTPKGPSRLIITLPCAEEQRSGAAVHGDRVAYVSDSTVFVARAGDSGGRPLVTLSGVPWSPIWSHDGNRLAVALYDSDADSTSLVVLNVTADDRLAAEPLYLECGAKWWWDPQWLPDDTAVLLVGMVGMTDSAVWLISLDPEEPPTALTRDEGDIWFFVLSPDGERIAFPKEVSGAAGSSIWKVDLSEAFESR